MDVGGLRFSGPATTRTLQRAQMPTPPQELPRGAETRRATSSSVSFARAVASFSSGLNVTSFDAAFTGLSHRRAKLSSAGGVYYSMRTTADTYDETTIAEKIVSILPDGVARQFSAERETIRYSVRADGLKLRTIVLSRKSLRKLADDPAAAVKIEYLQRDLLATATERREFRYPRPVVHPVSVSFPLPKVALA